jgi:hypothetical protein
MRPKREPKSAAQQGVDPNLVLGQKSIFGQFALLSRSRNESELEVISTLDFLALLHKRDCELGRGCEKGYLIT